MFRKKTLSLLLLTLTYNTTIYLSKSCEFSDFLYETVEEHTKQLASGKESPEFFISVIKDVIKKKKSKLVLVQKKNRKKIEKSKKTLQKLYEQCKKNQNKNCDELLEIYSMFLLGFEEEKLKNFCSEIQNKS